MGCQIQPRTDTTPAPEMQIIPNPSAATKVALDNPHPLDFAVAAAHNAHHRVLAEEHAPPTGHSSERGGIAGRCRRSSVR